MVNQKKIQLISRNKIDDSKWNLCVINSAANLGYGHTHYLDAICENSWVGLVFKDYEAVFPLPIKRFLGVIPYIVQPKFCQQLGAFGNNAECTESDFIRAIPWCFIRVRLHLNPYYQDHSTLGFANETVSVRTNFILNLHDPVKINKDGLKNIHAVSDFTYLINRLDAKTVIEFYKTRWGSVNQNIKTVDYQRLLSAIEKLGFVNESDRKSLGFVVVSAHPANESQNQENPMENNTAGAGLFLVTTTGTQRFAHFILGAQNIHYPGSQGIMHGILHNAIQYFQNKVDVFDFEGSSIPSVRDFYKKFNPIDKPFRIVKKGI